MELDFQKQKKKYTEMSDAELIARSRDQRATATERMLIDAEIAKRGLDRNRAPARRSPVPEPRRRKSNLFSIIFVAIVIVSVLSGIFEEIGFDFLEWLRDLFQSR